MSKFNKRYQKLFEKRKFNNLYCVKNFTYNIYGTFLHDKYSFLIFDFYQCKNSTSNGNKCKPQEKIDYYLNSTFISVEFTDISINPSNYSYPDTPILGETYSTIGSNFYKEMHIYLKSVLFKSDIGLMFTSIQEDNYLQLDYINDMLALQVRDMFCSFTLKISNPIDVYKRTYIKFQTTLANIGGIIKGISLIGFIITFFYSKTSYEQRLVNQIFNISMDVHNSNQKLKTEAFFGNIKPLNSNPDNSIEQNYKITHKSHLPIEGDSSIISNKITSSFQTKKIEIIK